jgi:hypothetical protein
MHRVVLHDAPCGTTHYALCWLVLQGACPARSQEHYSSSAAEEYRRQCSRYAAS